jgi:putative nucleotidyltransferase with HDIG domain
MRKNRKSFLSKIKIFINKYFKQLSILISLTIILSLFFQRGRSLQYSYNIDDIAREPIIAPYNFPILKSKSTLEEDLNNALKAEPFIFSRKQEIVDNQTSNLSSFFQLTNEIRLANKDLFNSRNLVYDYRYTDKFQEAKSIASSDSAALSQKVIEFYKLYSFAQDKEDWNIFLMPIPQGGPQFSLKEFQEDILQICRNRWAIGILDIKESIIISDQLAIDNGDIPTLYNLSELNDLNEAWTEAKKEITSIYGAENDIRRELGYDLIIEFMIPNLVYDKETTERRQNASLDRVPRSKGIVLKDEMIVNANQRITEEDLQKLQSLAVEISKENRTLGIKDSIITYIGRLLIIGILISYFFTFLLIYRSHIFEKWQLLLVIAFIYVFIIVIANIFVYQLDFSEFLIPVTVAAMLLTILFDARIGFMGTTSIVLLVGIMIGNDLEFIVTGLFMSSIAMYTVRRIRTRSKFITAIFSLMGASIIAVLSHGLFMGHNVSTMGVDLSYLLVSSIFAPIITYGLIIILEVSFGITTDLSLIELLDFNHPLLKRLQQEANGTFNHSVVVGNLAEACADAINARSLLCRVGAYYHDLGKMERPEYYIENQFMGDNKHDSLTPAMSAKIIRKHVIDGLKLAKDYGLPRLVSDFIPMHHGTSRVEYFYRMALEAAKDTNEKVDDSAYRYPGPKPNTKETGILMICEAVEAAVRSIKEPDILKIDTMVDKVIKGRLNDGQLDECPLTLDDLRKIKGTVDGNSGMLPVLRGIYHIRIEYPEDDNPSDSR